MKQRSARDELVRDLRGLAAGALYLVVGLTTILLAMYGVVQAGGSPDLAGILGVALFFGFAWLADKIR